METTRIQRFYAEDGPEKLWFALVPASLWIFGLLKFDPQFSLMSDLWYLFSFILLAVFGIPISFWISWFAGSIVISSLYDQVAIMNGGPFHIGDAVRILTGDHEGKVARITGEYMGRRFWVDLGDEATALSTNLFHQAQLAMVEPERLCLD